MIKYKITCNTCHSHLTSLAYAILQRGADKSLARPNWKKAKGRHFSSDAGVIAAAETCLDGQLSNFFFFLSGLQKLVWSL